MEKGNYTNGVRFIDPCANAVDPSACRGETKPVYQPTGFPVKVDDTGSVRQTNDAPIVPQPTLIDTAKSLPTWAWIVLGLGAYFIFFSDDKKRR